MKYCGIGIRFFLDMEVIYLKNKDTFDYNYINEKLEECNLKEFEKNSRQLCEYWFEGKKDISPVIKKMASYVISSGLLGTTEQLVCTETAKNAGRTNSKLVSKIKKCINIIMSPYETMAERYPILKNHKWLTPAYRIRRSLSAIIKKRDLIKSVTSSIDRADISTGKQILEFKKSIGL